MCVLNLVRFVMEGTAVGMAGGWGEEAVRSLYLGASRDDNPEGKDKDRDKRDIADILSQLSHRTNTLPTNKNRANITITSINNSTQMHDAAVYRMQMDGFHHALDVHANDTHYFATLGFASGTQGGADLPANSSNLLQGKNGSGTKPAKPTSYNSTYSTTKAPSRPRPLQTTPAKLARRKTKGHKDLDTQAHYFDLGSVGGVKASYRLVKGDKKDDYMKDMGEAVSQWVGNGGILDNDSWSWAFCKKSDLYAYGKLIFEAGGFDDRYEYMLRPNCYA